MKKYLFFLSFMMSTSLLAQELPQPTQTLAQDNCELLIEQAEATSDKAVYDQCGFNDAVRAFEYWGPYVSNKNYKKALFELAARHPEHEYAELYIQNRPITVMGRLWLKLDIKPLPKGAKNKPFLFTAKPCKQML